MEEGPKQEALIGTAQGGNAPQEGQVPAPGEPGKEGKAQKKGEQSPEERRIQAAIRREREAKEYQAKLEQAAKEAYERGLRDGRLRQGGKNEFTGEPIRDEYDLKAYEDMKALEARGEDPLKAYPRVVAEAERERNKKSAEAKAKAEADGKRMEAEISEAIAKHPELNGRKGLAALLDDEGFRDYAAGKIGERPLSDLVDGFYRLTGKGAKGQAKPPLPPAPPSARGGGGQGDYRSLDRASRKEFLRKRGLLK